MIPIQWASGVLNNRLPPPNPVATSSAPFCHDLPFISDGNSTFCGLSKFWRPITDSKFLEVIANFCIIFIPLTIYLSIKPCSCLIKYWKKCCKEGIDPIYVGWKWHLYLCTIKNTKILKLVKFVEIVLLTTLMLLYNAVDIYLDFKLFFEYSTGRLVDSVIYDNSSLVFYSMIFLLFTGYFFKIFLMKINIEGWYKNQTSEYTFDSLKLHLSAISLLFEDAPELMLEYFYMEKYIHTDSKWWIVSKDTVSGIYAFILCIVNLIGLKAVINKENKDLVLKIREIIISITVVIFSIASFFRIGGAIYQYQTQEVRKACFKVIEGRIIQTPFATGCLRGIDYVALVIGSLSLIGTTLILFSFFAVDMIMSSRGDNS